VAVEPELRRVGNEDRHATVYPAVVCRTPAISCEAVPASIPDGAGMRRHVHSGNHAAESFVCFIPLFGGSPR
jgi:hypothetical protein